MRRCVLSALGSTFLGAFVALSTAPAQAVPISAPAALKGAGEAINLTGNVCYGYGCGGGYGYGGYYGPPRRYYYRPYYSPYYYRPRYYNTYDYGYRPYRPYYRPYGYGYGYGYRPEPWVSGPYYSRPRYYIGPSVYY
jgi:hypothetical protein